MRIPNGLTLNIRNKRNLTRKLGDNVLNNHEQTYIHFSTVEELREALRVQTNREIEIVDAIPQEVLDLLEVKVEQTPEEEAASKGGLFYRDEFMKYQREMGFAEFQVVRENPVDAKVGQIWIIDPNAPIDGGGTV